MTNLEKYEKIIAHIRRVEQNCCTLAKVFINDNKPKFALELIRRGRMHDLSKFELFEFENLWDWEPAFKTALKHHHINNSHHPEHHEFGVNWMSDMDIAEMVCDMAARSSEFGTDVREFIFGEFAKKHGFSKDDYVGAQITRFLNLLLAPPFKEPSGV